MGGGAKRGRWDEWFAIGEDSQPASVVEQDLVDNANLCKVLSEEVIPVFMTGMNAGFPPLIATIRRSMATMLPKFTTWRMVQEYALKYYLPASGSDESREH
jgi:starch phosphorylase